MKEIQRVQEQLEIIAKDLGYSGTNEMIEKWLECAKNQKVSEYIRGLK